MNKKLLLIAFIFSGTFSFAGTINKPVQSQYGFIENKGQIIDQNNQLNPSVLYLYNGNCLHVQLKQAGFSYEVWKVSTSNMQLAISNQQKGNLTNLNNKLPEANSQQPAANTADSIFIHRIDISFVNANQNAIITASQPASDYINYYTTGTSEAGVTNVHHYKKVLYQNIYPNIDVEFCLGDGSFYPSGRLGGAFKYNFIIRPGGNPNDIQLKFDGANSTSLTKDGHIIIETAYGNIDESIPYSYQLNEQNNQQTISASFITHNSTLNTYGLNVGTYDANKTLIIDPAPWSTYFGGSSGSSGTAITTDAVGNITITGGTSSTSSIATSGAYQTIFGGGTTFYPLDAFIARFNSAGTQLKWATYYGGSGQDNGQGIANDASGNNIFITGSTNSTSGIASSGAYQTSNGGGVGNYDAYILKLDSTGTRQWSTYFGGSGDDRSTCVATDVSANNISISGYTTSTTSIATSGAYQTSNAGGTDAFIAVFSPSGAIQWSTYFGGSGTDVGNGITNDISGNIYLAGTSSSTSGIATSGAYLTVGGGAFIVKFTSSGSRLWGTYYPVNYGVNAIAADASGNVCITGYVTSVTGFATSGAYQTTFGGGNYDAYIVKFSTTGSLLWTTYYGGNGTDQGNGIAFDVSGNIILTGFTSSTNGIATFGSHQTVYNTNDAFIAKFSAAGAIQWATYYGGRRYDQGVGITTDINGNILLTGNTASADNIATAGVFQTSILDSTQSHTYIAKFTGAGALYSLVQNDSITGTQTICSGNSPTALSGSMPSGGFGPFTFKWQKSTISSTIGFANAGGNDSSQNYSPLATNTNTWYRRIAMSGGAFDTSASIAVSIKLRSGFTINNSGQCVNGNNFIFTDTTFVNGGTLSRQWNFGTGATDTSTLINPSKTYTSSGIYSVKLVSISTNGCVDSVTKIVTVNPKPNVGFTINNNSQCLNGNNFAFNDTSNALIGTLTRVWNFSISLTDTSTAISPTKVYSSSGTNAIKLIVNNNGCKDSVTKTITVNPKPLVGFTINNSSQCLNGNNFLFTDTSSINSGTITRQWNFGTGTNDTSSANNPSKVYTSTNTYSVKLISTSNNGCKDSITKNVTINPKPSVGFTINNTSQCLTGNNFLFTDTSSIISGTITRQWNLGTGATDTSSAINPYKVYTSANTYSVKLISTSNRGCKDSITKNVTINPKPSVGFTVNNTSQCLTGNNFLFADTSSIISGTINRQWNFGTGTTDTSSSNNPSKVYISANSYSIKLVSTSNYGCKDSITKIVTVNSKPTVGFSVNNSAQCLNGNNFLFNDTSSIGLGTIIRNWDFGNGTNSSNINPSISYPNANTYFIKLVSMSNNGCKDSLTKPITVNPKPSVGFTQNYIAQCLLGNSFVLNDTSIISSGTINRLWNFGDATTSSAINTTKSYSFAGTYPIKLVSISNNNCKDSVSKTVTIYSQPKSGFTINTLSQCLIGNSFSFDDTTYSTTTRIWDLGDFTTNTNDTFSKTYSNAGTYTVKLKVTDAHSCSDSSIKVITVKASPAKPIVTAITKSLLQSTSANSYQWYLNNSIITSATNQTLIITQNGNYTVKIDTTNGCTNLSNSFPALSVGIAGINNSDNEIRIYPNPATSELHIETSGNEKFNVQLFDITGKEVLENISFVKSVNFSTELLSEGIYFVRISDTSGVIVKTQKVAVTK